MTEIIMDKPKDMAFTNFSAMKRYIVEEITKYQNQALKVQASMMMMAQANQQPSMVLSLLQGI